MYNLLYVEVCVDFKSDHTEFNTSCSEVKTHSEKPKLIVQFDVKYVRELVEV